MKTFLAVNFGCRVNSAETNLWAQTLINQGLFPAKTNPDVILVNTCSITKKGEYESLSRIRDLSVKYPKAKIIATGCADLSKIESLSNLQIYSNLQKEQLLTDLQSSYTRKIRDKFSQTHRYLLKIQSGCSANCTYCTVPLKRTYNRNLSLESAIRTVNSAIVDGYQEIIITGVNLNQYLPGFSNLVESLLKHTSIPLISFGSIPLLCLDQKFISLYQKYPHRLSRFLHVPLQSGSDRILKLMNRPYNHQKIISIIKNCKLRIKNLSLGTDIIVGFPGETDQDYQKTYDLCQHIGFSKIHVFRYSPRPGTPARKLFLKSPKIPKTIILDRSKRLRQLSTAALKSDGS